MSIPSHMTKIEGVPDSSEAKPGMAFFANTGPFGSTCGECIHRGYRRESRNGTWNEAAQAIVHKRYSVQSCAMFKKLSGHHGPMIDRDWPSCKYFERKAAAQTAGERT